MEKSIEVAQSEGANKITLYTNLKLISAIELYKKFGFSVVSLDNPKYLEADIKMELEFTN